VATSNARQLPRIERMYEGLRRLAEDAALAVIAAQCGFSHGAHMAREFRALTDLSPAGVRRDLAHHAGLPWRIASAGL
jgi:AraC-like DNA-binding protein